MVTPLLERNALVRRAEDHVDLAHELLHILILVLRTVLGAAGGRLVQHLHQRPVVVLASGRAATAHGRVADVGDPLLHGGGVGLV